MSQYILALDQGTTSSRAIAFDRSGNIAALSQQSLPQHYPQAGWVEHDPLEIWDTQRRAAAEVIARLPEGSVAGIGVTNQRETTILWDKPPVNRCTTPSSGSAAGRRSCVRS